MTILKSKYACSLLVEIGHSTNINKAQIYLDSGIPRDLNMSQQEMLCMVYEILQTVPYRGEQDAEAAYHINKALKEISKALAKIDV